MCGVCVCVFVCVCVCVCAHLCVYVCVCVVILTCFLQSFLLREQSCTMAGSGEVKETELENQDWIKQWDAHTIGFHKEYIHPYVNFFSSECLY